MRLGLIITTYNRPEYLKECLESVFNADLTDTTIYIVDDASTDKEAIRLINSFSHKTATVKRIIKTANGRIVDSLLTGFDEAVKDGCDILMNLDGDCVVRNDFAATILYLHLKNQDTIVTGFNCLTRQANGLERHEIVDHYTNHNFKKTVGGCNMLFNVDVYNKIVRPSLTRSLKSGNWDHITCLALNKTIASTVPSVVQHIGVQSSMGHTNSEKPDVADDFKSLSLPCVTLVIVDCVNLDRARKAVDESVKDIQFAEVKILSSIDGFGVTKIAPIKSAQEYSRFILKELHRFIHTDYCLIIQYDGYVKNAKAWKEEFLECDYIGATWWYKDGKNVGNGGFSLRSKKLLQVTSSEVLIKDTHPEDDLICRKYRPLLEEKHGIKYAEVELADTFSIEGNPTQGKKDYAGQFGFHGSMVNFNVKVKSESEKTIIINQFQGLGDILFFMSAAQEWKRKGFKIIWPVVSDYVPIGKHFPGIEFIDKTKLPINYSSQDFLQTRDGMVVPLYWAHQIMGVNYHEVMKSKYMLFNGDWKTWRNYSFERDRKAEDALFYDVFGLKDGEDYVLTNKNFRTDKSGSTKDLPDFNCKVVEMKSIKGFTMIDWSKVIENAKEIHTVGTSVNYLIEVLNCKADAIHLYVRKPDEKDFKNYDYILTDKYKYHFHYEKEKIKTDVYS